MSAAKHTPGPWNLVSNHNTIAIQKGPNGALSKDAQPIVAWPGFDSAHFSHEVNLANAKLIAAAPGLADALETEVASHVADGCCGPGRGNKIGLPPGTSDYCHFCTAARSALRKAGVLP